MTQRDRDAAILYDAILDVVIKASMRCPCTLRQVQEDLRERVETNADDPFYAHEDLILKGFSMYLGRLIARRKDSPCHS